MSGLLTTARDLVGFYAFTWLIGQVPDEVSVPKDYWISTYADTVLSTSNQIVGSIRMEPEGLTDVAWPFQKLFGEGARLLNYALFRPFFYYGTFVEGALRGDFSSSTEMARQNVEAMQQHNETFSQLVETLPPIAERTDVVLEILKQNIEKLSKDKADLESQIETAQEDKTVLDQVKKMLEEGVFEKAIQEINTLLESPAIQENKMHKERLTELSEKVQILKQGLETKQHTLNNLQEEVKRLSQRNLEAMKKIKGQ